MAQTVLVMTSEQLVGLYLRAVELVAAIQVELLRRGVTLPARGGVAETVRAPVRAR